MRTIRFPRSRRLGINMTPMIDMVFLLIIFFLVSNHLGRQESLLKVDLPQAASGEQPAADSLQRLTLTVLPDGSLYAGGQLTTQPAIESRLRALVAEGGAAVEVRVRASRDLPYRIVEPLMVACAKHGITQFTFAVHDPEAR